MEPLTPMNHYDASISEDHHTVTFIETTADGLENRLIVDLTQIDLTTEEGINSYIDIYFGAMSLQIRSLRDRVDDSIAKTEELLNGSSVRDITPPLEHPSVSQRLCCALKRISLFVALYLTLVQLKQKYWP